MMVNRRAVVVGLCSALVALILLSGCGGGGDGNPPPPGQVSSVRGSVDAQGTGGDYEVLLDGQPVPGAMQADGTFVIYGVPPGEHRIAVVESGGMEGGYATVSVRPGEDTEVPPIAPELGGQIVGMVTVRDDDGLRPLVSVEVTAQPALVILAADSDDDAEPDVWPPAELPTFSTFTDDDGSYLIRAVPEGEYIVSVATPEYAENWQWVWVEAGHTAVADFELRPAVEPGVGTVQGRVMGESSGGLEPIAGAMVSIYSDDPWMPPEAPVLDGEPANDESEEGEEGEGGGCDDCPPGMQPPDDISPPWFYGVNTLTDAEGFFSLNAPAGYASIEVFALGYEPVWEEIIIEGDTVLELNFALEPMPEFPPLPPDLEPGPGTEPELPPAPPSQ